jgi:hypothetical protein
MWSAATLTTPRRLVRAAVVCRVFIAFFMVLEPRFIEFINRVAPRFSHVCLALAALASYIDVGAVFGALIGREAFRVPDSASSSRERFRPGALDAASRDARPRRLGKQ